LTLEQANAKPGLTRFHYGKQAILKGALAHKNVPVLAYVNRNDLEAALMQGTVVAEINRHEKIFNVHRTNNIAYDKTKNPLAQERYWYFKQVDGIKGYGKDAEHKITVNTQVTFAADLQKFGLGKLLLVQYPESNGALVSRVGILADTGGAFVNNQYQIDFLSGTYAGPEAFYKANRGIPDYVVAYFMVLKEETSSANQAPSVRLGQGKCVAQPIHKMPIQFDEERIALTRDYQLTHYGITSKSIEIEPKMIVLHWTSIESLATTWRIFNPPTFPENSPRVKELPGTLNVSSHFLVDRDGSIYQLMPEKWMARHTIGLNHYAIGIENIGGKDAQDDLTDAQVKANAFLVCYLKKKYPKIDYVIGHNTYLNFKNTALWLEKDPNYQTDKYDPGPDFVNKVLGLLALNT
jgi:N-acetyl-anhydromuramyl-L-alanine amidase AmpD